LEEIEAKLRTLGCTSEAEEREAARCQVMALQARERMLREQRQRTVSDESRPESSEPEAALPTAPTADQAGPAPSSAVGTEGLPPPAIPEALAGLWDANLLHQLAIDPSFRLQAAPAGGQPDLGREVAAQAKRAVFHLMAEELSTTPPSARMAALGLRQLVEDLQACTLPRQAALRDEIQAAFDIDLLCQQVLVGPYCSVPAVTAHFCGCGVAVDVNVRVCVCVCKAGAQGL
jgi:hypothetical protein